MQKIGTVKVETTGNQDPYCKLSNPLCATSSIDSVMKRWKQEPSPYDDPVYQEPSCQREKIITEQPKRVIRCGTPVMDEVMKLEAEYDRRIAAGETENEILKSWVR